MDSGELLRELRRAVDGLRAFNDAGRSLTSTLDEGEVLAIILDRVGGMLRPAAWSLVLTAGQGDELAVQVAVGEGTGGLVGRKVPPGQGLCGWVAQSGQAVLLERAGADARFAAEVDPAPPGGPASFMAAPLRALGRTLGVLALAARPEAPFAPDDLRTLVGLAEYAAIALANARHFERMRELTLLDDHTGLYNARHLRRALEAEVQRASRFGRSLSLLFLDLDRFKDVNDAHGHQAGSALLREAGEVLRAGLRAMDVPVRYGGDEFVVILPETGRQAARAVAERLREALRETVFLRGQGLAVRLSASIGIATWPEDGPSAEALLRAADGAMYRAKERGRDGVAAHGDAADPGGGGSAPSLHRG